MDDRLEIEAHSTEPAILLRFNGPEGKEQLKIIQLKGLSPNSDVSAIARFVLHECQQLIPANRRADVERSILHIQMRQRNMGNKETSSLSQGMAKISIEKLDEYIEMLYEEGESKQRCIALISELAVAMAAQELPKIAQNEQLMGALVRTWKEDAKRNFELAIHLAQLFHRLSQFALFHPILAHWKIGLLSFQLVEHELHRAQQWRQQMQEIGDVQVRRKWEFALRKQDQLISVCFRILLNLGDDLRTEHKMLRKGLLPMLFRSLEHHNSTQLLSAALKLLCKCSQFAEVQRHIADTPNTVERLICLLSRNEQTQINAKQMKLELLAVLFSTLYNCSFEPSSRRRMVQAGLVTMLAPYLQEYQIALVLMYQLSVVDDAKAMVVFTDCIPTLLDLLLQKNGSVGASQSTELHQNEKQHILVKSLLLNLVLEKRNAQLLCGSDGQGLDALMQQAFNDGDVLTIKIARNIATHEGQTREMFVKWMPRLLESAIAKINASGNAKTSEQFGLECLAICALCPEASWLELENEHGIVAFLGKLIRKSTQEKNKDGIKLSADVLLQAILLCGILAEHSPQLAEQIVQQLLPFLIRIINDYQEDDEIVLQCVYTIVSLLAHGGTIASQLCSNADDGSQAKIVELLLNLMHDKNPRLRSLCDHALVQIAEINPYWRTRIQEARFRWHNAQWLEMVQTVDTSNQMVMPQDEALLDAFQSEFVLNSEDLLRDTDF